MAIFHFPKCRSWMFRVQKKIKENWTYLSKCMITIINNRIKIKFSFLLIDKVGSAIQKSGRVSDDTIIILSTCQASAMLFASPCIACVKTERDIVLLRAMFWTLHNKLCCVRAWLWKRRFILQTTIIITQMYNKGEGDISLWALY